MDTTAKSNFDATVRFRVPVELLARLERIAAKRVKRVPELSREALVRFVEAEEAKDQANGHRSGPNQEEAA